MKARHLLGAVAAVSALTIAGVALAQTTLNVPVQMSVASAASAALGNPINFGTIIAAPGGGEVTLTGSNTVGGAGQLGNSGTPTVGTIAVTRTGAVTAAANTPAPINLTCGAATVQVAVTPVNTACSAAGTTACTISLEATATLPSNMAAGACTAGSVTLTVSYN